MLGIALGASALLTTVDATAQTYNNTHKVTQPINHGYTHAMHRLTTVEDGNGFIQMGSLAEQLSPGSSYYETRIALAKTNLNGSIILWKNKIGLANYDLTPTSMIQSNVAGESVIIGSKSSKTHGKTTTMIIKINNTTGNVIWAREYEFADFNTGDVIISRYQPPGYAEVGYMFAGTWSDNSVNNTNNKIAVTAIDENGVIIHHSLLEISDPTFGVPTSMCFRDYTNSVKIMGVNDDNSTFTIGIDNAGLAVNEPYDKYTYGGHGIEDAGFIHATSDDGFIMALQTQTLGGSPFGPSEGVLVKVDLNDIIMWAKRYSATDQGLAVYEDVVNGAYHFYVRQESPYQQHPGILTVTSSGFPTGPIRYFEPHPSYGDPSCMIPATSGGYLMTGTVLYDDDHNGAMEHAGFFHVKADGSNIGGLCDHFRTTTSTNNPCTNQIKSNTDLSLNTSVNNFYPSEEQINFGSVDCIGSALKKPATQAFAEDLAANGFSMFPNPVSDRLTIHPNLIDREVTVQLMDHSGRFIMSAAGVNQVEMDLSNVSNGVYLIKVFDAQGTYMETSRIVKQ